MIDVCNDVSNVLFNIIYILHLLSHSIIVSQAKHYYVFYYSLFFHTLKKNLENY